MPKAVRDAVRVFEKKWGEGMKCPFQTVKTVTRYYANSNEKKDIVKSESVFADCLKDECPYYTPILYLDPGTTGRSCTVLDVCKKVAKETEGLVYHATVSS